jgi:hypothetical protein
MRSIRRGTGTGDRPLSGGGTARGSSIRLFGLAGESLTFQISVIVMNRQKTESSE